MRSILEKISSLNIDLVDLTPEYVEWMWDVKELTPFLEWYVKYIEKSNCVDNRHLSLYEAVCDNSDLDGDKVDQALQVYGINIFDYQYSDLSVFDLDFFDLHLKELREQNDQAADVESLITEEIHRALSHEEIVEERLRAGQADCQKEGQNLMKINAPLKSIISNFFSNFFKLISVFQTSEDPDFQNNCISSLSLESLLNSCEKFCEYANLCLKQKFEQPSFSEKRTVSELMSFLEEESSMRSITSSSSSVTADLLKKMWHAELTKIELQGSLSGLTSAVQHIQTLMKSPSLEKANILTMKLEAGNIKGEIYKLSQNVDFLIKHNAGNIAEDIVLSNIFQVVENICKVRIQRRQTMLRELCSVISVIGEFLHHTDLVWMLIMHDSQRFRFGTELLKEASDICTEELRRHDATMCGLKMIIENGLGEDALTNGQSTLLNVIQRLLDSTFPENECVDIASSENEQKELEKDLLCNILESLEKLHPGREKSISELRMELTKGPTKKPNLIKVELSLSIHEALKKLENCKFEVDQLSSQFSANQMAFKKSPIARNRRLLWAWFLVAPEKLKEAVNLAVEEQ